MLEAALWGLVGGLALAIGAAIALWLRPRERSVAYVMAFGAGVLISAVAFELTEEAIGLGGGDSTALGLAAGALTYFAGDWLLERRSVSPRRPGGRGEDETGIAIVLGALLDGVPESIAIGITLIDGSAVSAAFVAAVFLSNLPEAISASSSLAEAGRRPRWIIRLWIAIAAIAAIAAGLGYAVLGGVGGDALAFVNAFAAGAILVMLADTMIPEAFERAGRAPAIGLVTTLGFTLAALLSTA